MRLIDNGFSALVVGALVVLTLTTQAAPPAFEPLPDPVSSFGAAVDGDFLYVYSGHRGKTHVYDRDGLSPGFRRMNLRTGGAWEELPGGPRLQGLAMAAHAGKIYRVGGLEARNAPGTEADLHSTDRCEVFDPATKQWSPLPSLPQPRSSHAAAVVGDKLYVFGGWTMNQPEKSVWARSGLVLDLSIKDARWQSLPQPAARRAMSLQAVNGKLWLLGGLTPDDATSNKTYRFDPATSTWTDGPKLPGIRLNGTGNASDVQDGRLYLSGADGIVYRLNADETAWENVGTVEPARLHHRMFFSEKDQLIVVGGASRQGNFKDLLVVRVNEKVIPIAPKTEPASAAPAATSSADTWPAFRNTGDSQTAAKDLPLTWSDSEHVAWRAPLRGEGQSSPVIWKGRAFVTSIEGQNKETLHLACVDLADGKPRWQWKRAASSTTKNSDMTSKAAPTPVIDAQRVYAFFESGDLIAFDHDGKPLWERALTKDYAPFQTNHGLGGSPVLCDGKLLVLVAQKQGSYLLAIDPANGKTLWKADRPYGSSWTTPTVVSTGSGGALAIVSSNGVVDAVSLADGRVVWSVNGLKGNTVASPSVDGQTLLVAAGEAGAQIAIKLGGRGDVTASHVLWQSKEADCSFGSPVIVGGRAYFTNKVGVAHCLDLATGKVVWKERLAASCWASPVAAADRIYFFSTNGDTTVYKAGTTAPERLAQNKLTVAGRVLSVAAVDRTFLLRTPSELICIK